MNYDTDDWTLRHEQTREGELYREKMRLKQEKEDAEHRRNLEDYEREQSEYRAEEQRRADREARNENIMNMSDMIQTRDEDIEHLRLCLKFGIEEEFG